MGRNSKTRELALWINGVHAADWLIPASGGHELRYTTEWAQSAQGRPLSMSLPYSPDSLSLKGPVVERYFDNLLPDSDAIRQRLRDQFATGSIRPFDLLAAIGRDCVGAVQLLPPGEERPDVRRISAEPLDDSRIERLLADSTGSHRLTQDAGEGLRVSLAGAQEKTALLKHQGRWCRPLGATPTTHIFKLPLGLIGGRMLDMSASLENEWLCSRILHAYRIPIARCEIGEFGAERALIVERFDRQLHSSGKYWLRLMQEDFCQALGLPPSMKYEADGGPGVVDIALVLRRSVEREQNLAHFIKAQILFWMLAAGDGHAKNFSVQILEGGRFRLAPLYDVLSYHPIIGNAADQLSPRVVKLAMAQRGKNKHYLLKDIQRRHFNETARRAGFGASAEPLIEEILAVTPAVIAAVRAELPEWFPKRVGQTILGGLVKARAALAKMTP